MRRIFVPHLGHNVVLGGCRLTAEQPKMRLSHVASKHGVKLISPDSIAWNNQSAMKIVADIEGNDDFGDCVCAEEAHFVAIVTSNAKGLFSYTRPMTLSMYTILTGFDQNNPNTDQGTDPLVCLDYFRKHPYADGTTNSAYLQVDATNKDEVKYAISTFGNLKLWLALPDSYVNPFPSKNGQVWDVDTPNPENGHCIGACGYIDTGAVPQLLQVIGVTEKGVAVMTWGLVIVLTWEALAELCVPKNGGGAAVRVTSDWLNSNGKSPTGLALTQLIADLTMMPNAPNHHKK
jgi:hypothetical protein